MGLYGALASLDIGWWIPTIIQFLYIVSGRCPLTWTGLSREAFYEIWPFVKLSVSFGVMMWLVILIFEEHKCEELHCIIISKLVLTNRKIFPLCIRISNTFSFCQQPGNLVLQDFGSNDRTSKEH